MATKKLVSRLTYVCLVFLPIQVFAQKQAFSLVSAEFSAKTIDSLSHLLPLAKDTSRVNILNKLAYCLYYSNPNQARLYSKEAVNLAQQLNFESGLAQGYRLVGLTYELKNNYAQALELYIKALRINEKINCKACIATNLGDLGDIYRKQREYEKALDYYVQSLRMRKKINDEKEIATVLNNIGIIYRIRGDFTRALDNHSQSLHYFKNDKNGTAITLYYIGMVYEATEDYESALEYYRRSFPLLAEVNDKESLAEVSAYLGAIHTKLEKYDTAFVYLERGIQIAKEINSKNWEFIGYAYLSDLYERKGDISHALLYYKKYTSLKESVYNVDNSRIIADLQTAYEVEKQQAQINFLYKDQLIQARKLHRQQLISEGIIASLLLVLIITFLLYRGVKREKSNNKILLGKNKMISHQKEEITAQSEQLQEANEELEQINENLEQLVQERTEVLEQQNERLAEYAFINAHKLRGPLASIMGLVNLIDTIRMHKPDQELVEHLKKSTQQLDNIIREIGDVLEDKNFFSQNGLKGKNSEEPFN